MKAKNLFVHRLVKGWKYQYDVVKSVADWTVMLYIIIPAAVFFAAIYRTWWSELPTWFKDVPLILVFLLFYLISWVGTIRTYMEEADKVFLIKKSNLIWKLKKYGYLYSIIFQSITIVAAIFILLPFLLQKYQMGWSKIAAWGIYFISLKACFMLTKYYLRKTLSRIRQMFKGIVLFIGFSWFSQLILLIVEKGNLLPVIICAGAILSVSIYFSLQVLRSISSLDMLIDMEREQKTSLIHFFFMAAPEIEKPVGTNRRKPLFFQNSKRIFKKRTPTAGFMELFIKVFIRNKSYVTGYFTLISVTTLAIIRIPPIWIKVLIFFGFLLMLRSWLSIVWGKVFSSHPLMKKYNESSFYFSAKNRVTRAMYIIAILLLMIFVSLGFMIISGSRV